MLTDDSKIAGKITEEMLKLHSDLRGVYWRLSGTDGVCKVLKNKSLVGKVKVISNDLTTRNEQELKRGTDPVPAWTERICAGIFSGDDFI